MRERGRERKGKKGREEGREDVSKNGRGRGRGEREEGRVRKGEMKYSMPCYKHTCKHGPPCPPPPPTNVYKHQVHMSPMHTCSPTHPSWVVMVTMYGKHRNRHIVVWVLVVHNWKPVTKTTTN